MSLTMLIRLIVLPVLALNLLGPLLIWRTQRLPARIRFQPHDEASFMASRDEAFRGLDADMRGLGFRYLGSSFMRDTHTETNFSLYAHDDQACAMVVSIVSKVKSIAYVEFAQLYADGSILDVTNTPIPSPYPRVDLKIHARFPEVLATAELHARFLALRASLKNTAQPMPYSADAGFRMVEDFMDRESDLMTRLGYCHPEVDADGRRPLTLKGAYLLSWRSIFPGRTLRGWREKQHSARLLADASAKA